GQNRLGRMDGVGHNRLWQTSRMWGRGQQDAGPAMLNEAIAGAALLIWLYLLVAHGRFWLGGEHDSAVPAPPARWPAVAAVVPARNEAGSVAESVGSLVRQDYPGPF